MPHDVPNQLEQTLDRVFGLQDPNVPDPGPDPDFAITTTKQGFGLRILVSIDFGATGTLNLSWSQVTPAGGSTYYPALRAVTDLSGFSDWSQIPDVDIELDNKEALFDGAFRRIVDIHRLYDFTNREMTVYFWMDGMPFSAAYAVAYLVARPPFEYNELVFNLRAVGIQRKLPDRIGDLATAADLANIHPEDAGKIFPLPFGSAKRVRGIRAKIAVEGELEGFIDENDTTLTLADATDFPASGTVKIGDEQITYSGKSGNDLTGLGRAAGGTAEATHFTGDPVFEVTSEVHVFAGFEASAINAVYGPNGGTITGGTIDLSDTALIAGKTLATVTFAAPPEEEIIEGATTFVDIPLETGSGSTINDPDKAHELENAYTPDNFARNVGGSTSSLVSRVPAGAQEDLGEIVKITLGVRHYGFGVNNRNIAVSVVSPSESLGNLAKGQALDSQGLSARAAGQVDSSGQSAVQTNIDHFHPNTIVAFGNSVSPADVTDEDCTGWVTLTGMSIVPACSQFVGPIFKRNVLEDGSLAIHSDQGSAEQIDILWDLVGALGDLNAKIKRVKLVIKHGHPLEASGTFTVRLKINGTTHVTNTYNNSSTPIVRESIWIDVSGRNYTLNDLHNGTSKIEIQPNSSFLLLVWVAYGLIEIEEPMFGSSSRAGTGPATVSGDAALQLSNKAKTWEEVEEFFPITALSDWSDLPSTEFQISGNPTNGSEVYIREVFVRVEYRARRRQKAEYLLADIDGAVDQNHVSGEADGFYTGTPGALIENPVDVFEYVLIEILGINSNRVDTTFNDTQRASYSGDSHVVSGALVESMDALRFIRRFLLEVRARFFLESTQLRLKYIPTIEGTSTFAFDRSNIILNEVASSAPIRVEEMSFTDVINDVALYFGRNLARAGLSIRPAREGVDPEAPLVEEFDGHVSRDDSSSITEHGTKRREFWLQFLGEGETTVANGIADVLVTKYADVRRKLIFEATFDSLAVAVDDVVAVDYPSLGFSSTLCRVTKETFIAGDPVTGSVPRKRYEMVVLFDSEQS